MVKFTADRNGRILIGLWISKGNIDRLKEGKPIHLNLEELNLPWRAEILVMYGETEQDIANQLSDYIGPHTIVNRDRKGQ